MNRKARCIPKDSKRKGEGEREQEREKEKSTKKKALQSLDFYRRCFDKNRCPMGTSSQ